MKTTLTVELFNVEALLLRELAEKAGIPVEAYCRQVLNAHIREQIEPGDGFDVERATATLAGADITSAPAFDRQARTDARP